jgi:hypothetical protein
MEMIRQKVYSLEQAQIKMKQEYVAQLLPRKRVWGLPITDLTPWTTIGTKLKSEAYDLNWNRAACIYRPLILEVRPHMLGRPRLHPQPLATVLTTCSAASWQIREVVPQLSRPRLPHKISNSLLSIPCNNPLLGHKVRLSHSKVLLVATSRVLSMVCRDLILAFYQRGQILKQILPAICRLRTTPAPDIFSW